MKTRICAFCNHPRSWHGRSQKGCYECGCKKTIKDAEARGFVEKVVEDYSRRQRQE